MAINSTVEPGSGPGDCGGHHGHSWRGLVWLLPLVLPMISVAAVMHFFPVRVCGGQLVYLVVTFCSSLVGVLIAGFFQCPGDGDAD